MARIERRSAAEGRVDEQRAWERGETQARRGVRRERAQIQSMSSRADGCGRYDEAFRGYGDDKAQHSYELHKLGTLLRLLAPL